MTRLDKAEEKIGGTYWDKVMKSNGTTGYCARETFEDEESYKSIIKQYFGVESEDELKDKLRLDYRRNKAVEEYIIKNSLYKQAKYDYNNN